MKNISQVKSSLTPNQVRPYAMDADTTLRTLEGLGVHISKNAMDTMKGASAMDAAPDMVTTPSATVPVQFLQHWLTDLIKVVTAKKDIDEILGRDLVGTFADEEIVQPFSEYTGRPTPYGDKAQPNQSSYNINLEGRTIVRFEESFEVGILEEERAAKMRINSAALKKEAAAEALAIEMNMVGWYGYANGANRTYGLLNDPNLPAYVTVAANGNSDTEWSKKSFEEIQNDILTAINAVAVNSKNNYNPTTDKATLVVSLNAMQWLNKANAYGKTVNIWLKETYPLIEVKASYFLDGANGGADVFYLFKNEHNGKKVINHYPVEVLRALGVWNKGKNYEEFYANATSGVFVKQPVFIYRGSGI